eukprot:4501330-Amphidinium_carterae.1
MIAIVAFAGLLAEPNEFQMGLQLALSLALLAQLLQPCNRVLQAHMRTQHTSRTTCWRHRLTIYFALRLLKRDHFLSAPTVRYEILDSSPQGGFHYLMRLTMSIELQHLAHACEVSVALCTPRALHQADHDEDALLHEIQTLLIVNVAACRTQSITSDFGVESRLAGVSVPLGQLQQWLREFDRQDPSSMHMQPSVPLQTLSGFW